MTLAAFSFADQWWLWLTGAFLALYGVLLWYSAHARSWQLAMFAEPRLLASLLAAHSRTRRIVKTALIILALIAIGLTLARPQWGVVPQVIQQRGEDVVFLLDLSNSMLAKDVSPNRLARSKLAILDYLHRQQGGRVGLVIFAGSSFLRCPLTMDYAAFEESLVEADPGDLYIPGTDLALAIVSAKNAFEKGDQRRLLVLITDGEDLRKAGIDKAKELAKDGIIIFTIGVGTPSGSEVLVKQPDGQPGPLLDETGQPVVSRLDEDTLRTIAESTGGSYRRLEAIGTAMSDVLRSLQSTQTKGSSSDRRRGIDRYAWFLAVAILLLVGESFITTRRRRPAASNA
jgi:Ca-activated chloride channel family protein